MTDDDGKRRNGPDFTTPNFRSSVAQAEVGRTRETATCHTDSALGPARHHLSYPHAAVHSAAYSTGKAFVDMMMLYRQASGEQPMSYKQRTRWTRVETLIVELAVN